MQSFDAMGVRMSFLSRPMTQRYQHLIFLVSAKQSKKPNCEILMDGNGTKKKNKEKCVCSTNPHVVRNESKYELVKFVLRHA